MIPFGYQIDNFESNTADVSHAVRQDDRNFCVCGANISIVPLNNFKK
ncbi:hypothetical protein GJA_3397 [Janthinobacterium agaricidamnosum NBRC 102515 = DSM 9628]|uniref:Uncharacterized protein n=1 Tax=Janthinobacterium agaricidamnosum NBRC 102515 = DSM 9628 TaxID=1349767 RepID=W0V811_9BURK|nr:hypothetical protein GJA_3397 [Janthinobacterium agaricidamnosum NBRC 102515 = DSM 9628]